MTASAAIELETSETLPGHETPITFSIPKEIARRQADIDQLISAMAAAIDQGQDAQNVVDHHEMNDECRQGMKTVAARMKDLHAADRNHVWAYHIRNMIRPAVVAEEKVDRIIGNPPWLTYCPHHPPIAWGIAMTLLQQTHRRPLAGRPAAGHTQ